jgi:hypothetical protein
MESRICSRRVVVPKRSSSLHTYFAREPFGRPVSYAPRLLETSVPARTLQCESDHARGGSAPQHSRDSVGESSGLGRAPRLQFVRRPVEHGARATYRLRSAPTGYAAQCWKPTDRRAQTGGKKGTGSLGADLDHFRIRPHVHRALLP